MKLSICIVNYYSERELGRFLESIAVYRPEHLFEVIVVDNSQSGIQSLKAEFGDWLHIIDSFKNVGYGQALNRAVKKAKGEYVFLCNPDLEAQDGSFQKLLHFADRTGEFGIIGPKLLFVEGGIQDSCRRFPNCWDLMIKRLGLSRWFPGRMEQYLMKHKKPDEQAEVDWLVGAALLMKRDTFQALRGFDERFFLFFEDTDLCRRCWEKQLSVMYYPDATFLHTRQRLSESAWPGFWIFKKVFWIHLISAGKYFWKWRKRSSE
ncbi:MAG: glycosyltransferase family 2 protein [bacterium]|nr:glycosyltransferase family 2 protein [bacterium]